jgi:hypothetical protein
MERVVGRPRKPTKVLASGMRVRGRWLTMVLSWAIERMAD